jgi:hypothetical protein
MRMPKMTEREPMRTRMRGEPVSKMRPKVRGEAQRRKEVRVPIQAMVLLEWVGRREVR